jgi:hypothetical protein
LQPLTVKHKILKPNTAQDDRTLKKISTVQDPSGAKPLPVMWGIVVDVGACWDNPVGVYRRVASVVVFPDVLHLHRAADARDLIDVLGVVEKVWVLPEELLVAFEVNSINLSKKNSFARLFSMHATSNLKEIIPVQFGILILCSLSPNKTTPHRQRDRRCYLISMQMERTEVIYLLSPI